MDDLPTPVSPDGEPDQLSRLRDVVGEYASWVRAGLRMLIGALLVVRVAWFAQQHLWGDADDPVTAGALLAIVGAYLAAATAVELAYFLFTPGPDEAYRPVLLASATAALLLAGAVTSAGTEWAEVGGFVAAVLLLVALLLLKPRIEEILDRGAAADARRKAERARRRREARKRPTVVTIKPPAPTRKPTSAKP